MRVKKSIVNILVGWGSQFVKILGGFVARTVFIQILSKEYLGLDSVFATVLQLLSFVELGLGAAVFTSLYEPIEKKEYRRQAALVFYSKRLFQWMAAFIAALGILLMPFLSVFIKDMPDIPYIRMIYLMFVLNTAVSYLSAHYSAYLIADQKNYVIRLMHSIFYLLMLLCQCIGLIITQNYFTYLFFQFCATAGETLACVLYTRHTYPDLIRYRQVRLEGAEKKRLLRNMNSLAYYKIGQVIVTSTDTMLLSRCVSLVAAGIYSNYYMIIMAVQSFLGQVFTSLVASVGNLHISAEAEKQEQVYKSIQFLAFFVYGMFSACLLTSINAVICIWLGEDFLMSRAVVMVLILNFLFQGLRSANASFLYGCGLYNEIKYTTVIETVLNFVISLALVMKIGVAGIFAGTILSYLLVGFWKEPKVLYGSVFEKPFSEYWKNYGVYFCLSIAGMSIMWFAHDLVGDSNLVGMICINAAYIVIFFAVVLILFKDKEYVRYFGSRFHLVIKQALMQGKGNMDTVLEKKE